MSFDLKLVFLLILTIKINSIINIPVFWSSLYNIRIFSALVINSKDAISLEIIGRERSRVNHLNMVYGVAQISRSQRLKAQVILDGLSPQSFL